MDRMGEISPQRTQRENREGEVNHEIHETHERESRGGLEEIAGALFTPTRRGFPLQIARVSLANRRVQSPSQRRRANASSIATRNTWRTREQGERSANRVFWMVGRGECGAA